MSQIRGDERNDAGAHEVDHCICGGTATPDEQALGSSTHRKLKQLSIWDSWLASERKELAVAPPGATVLRFHWN